MAWFDDIFNFGKQVASGNIATGITHMLGEQTQQEQAANEITAAQKQMKFQADQAKIQRDYETEMSNTAYQRAMADMAKAGLNPILAYSKGGASTPSVSAPSGAKATQTTGGKGITGNIASIATSALAIAKLLA